MANPFLDALDEYRRREQPATAPRPAGPLPTTYDTEQVPQGTLRDADTLLRPTGEVSRAYGIDSPELADKATHTQLLRPGQ